MIAANPVLQRELLERWRGRRATTALTVFLLVLAVVFYGLYRLGVTLLTRNSMVDVGLSGPALGRFLLESLLFTTLALVLCVVPAYAAGQVVGERERRTLPLLQATLLQPWQIVAGKLAAATAWMALLVVSIAPLAAATMFLGGVTVGDVVRAVASILVTMIGIGGVALGISANVRRTATAVVLTYAATLLLVFGSGAVALTSAILQASNGDAPQRPPIALYANPFYGLADAANASNTAAALEMLPSPLSVIALALPESPAFTEMQMTDDVALVAPMQQPDPGGGPTWLVVGAVYLALGVCGFAVATWRLRDPAVTPSRRSRGARHARRAGRRHRTAGSAVSLGAPDAPDREVGR